jgi:amino-acid N-acetyltransferase
MRFDDLRGILRYVPQFRQRIFVIALDGALMNQAALFNSILQEVAVLHSLNIEVVLVFGARAQIAELAAKRGVTPSSIDGMGLTDAATMEIAIEAITRQSSEIMADLTALELPAVVPNALVIHPAGVIDGVDQLFTGRIERVNIDTLLPLVKADIIPVLPPLGYDGRGVTLRLNSDAVAAELGIALQAAKIIYISESALADRPTQLSVAEAKELSKKKDSMDVNLLSKLRYGAYACNEGVARVHIINGTQEEALLSELFSNEGVGTMIHGDGYQAIRPARPGDISTLIKMMQQSVEDAALVQRTRKQIAERLQDYFVMELDGNPVGTVAVHSYDTPSGPVTELACLHVQRSHKGRGHGQKLVAFAENQAKQRGAHRVLALSTQASGFFEEKMAYNIGSPDDLPAERRAAYDKSGRNSKVLFKNL